MKTKGKIKRGALDMIVGCPSCRKAVRESWLMGSGCLKCQGREELPQLGKKAKKNSSRARRNEGLGADLPAAHELTPGIPVDAIASGAAEAPVIVRGPDGPLREPSGKLLIIGTVIKGPNVQEQVAQVFAEFQGRWEALQNPRRARTRVRRNPEPFATWYAPKRRYVGVDEIPLPAFKSPKGTILIWDLTANAGEHVPYSPTARLKTAEADFLVGNLVAPGVSVTEDDPDMYTVRLPADVTHAELVERTLQALDAYPKRDFSKDPPVMIQGFSPAGRRSPFGQVVLAWHKADPAYLTRKNPLYKPVPDPMPSNAGPYLPEMYPYGMRGFPAEYESAKKNPRRPRRKTTRKK